MSASTSAPVSKKRKPVESQHMSLKKQKVHPFFTKPVGDSSLKDVAGSAAGSFQWHASLGPKRTCLHGSNLASRIMYCARIAAFDLDGTLIRSTFHRGGRGKKSSSSSSSSSFASSSDRVFDWWNERVPGKLEELYKDGYSIVIISNQNIGARIEEFKKKILAIADALPGVPFRLLAATAKDGYRKPMRGMWYVLEGVYQKEGVEIDKASSFFVGDAAGRPQDFAGTDRKWAINVGVPFFTPEEYFLGKPSAQFALEGFDVSALKKASPVVPKLSKELEIVLFVGYPCLGKSTFYRKHFAPEGYVHINQDVLGSRPKCIKATEQALADGRSCVIDNTNRNRQTRKYYIDLGNKFGVPVRCFKFEGSMELAMHNNLYRAFSLPPAVAEQEPKRELLPFVAFSSFRNDYEDPHESEGFTDCIVTVNWVFEGGEEEKRLWEMWHQIEGK